MLTICTSFFSIPIILQLNHAVAHQNKYSAISTSLLTLNAVAVLGLVVTGSLFPRRPGVLFGKREVDQQWTVSALNRYTWSWIQPLLHHAYLHNDVAIEDLPVADAETRSETLAGQWNKSSMGTSLFHSLLRVYRRKFIILWLTTVVRCVVSIVPFWFMLRILNLLETPTGRPLSTELLILISFMAISNLLDSVRPARFLIMKTRIDILFPTLVDGRLALLVCHGLDSLANSYATICSDIQQGT